MVQVTGKAMHATRCHIGVSAIYQAAHLITELEKMKKQLGLSKIHDLVCLVISNRFYEGNAIMQKVILEYLLDNYK